MIEKTMQFAEDHGLCSTSISYFIWGAHIMLQLQDNIYMWEHELLMLQRDTEDLEAQLDKLFDIK